MLINRRQSLGQVAAAARMSTGRAPARSAPAGTLQSWPLATPQRTGNHDLAPAPDGGVWFTAQHSGHLGWFDPASGRSELIALGRGSSPHGVSRASLLQYMMITILIIHYTFVGREHRTRPNG